MSVTSPTPTASAQREDVEAVLTEIGAGGEGALLVEAWNKIDLLDGEEGSGCRPRRSGATTSSAFPALTGEGLDALARTRVGQAQQGRHSCGRGRPSARRTGRPSPGSTPTAGSRASETDGLETVFQVRLSEADWARLQSRL